MRKRSKIASIVLFLAALAVGFDAQPGWCVYAQCYISFNELLGVVVLPDHTLLAADSANGLYRLTPLSPVGNNCTTTITFLKSGQYQSLTMGRDGRVFSFKKNTFGTFDLVAVNLNGGTDTVLIADNSLNKNDPLGVALDPLTGDLFMTHVFAQTTVSRIIHLYDGGTPTIDPTPFGTFAGARFDGLAWSCDGTTLLVASPGAASNDNRIIKFTRAGVVGTVLVTLNPNSGPDGIVFGAAGTPLEGYVFSNNNNGEVDKIPLFNSGTQFEVITSGGQRGDWAFVDNQGYLLLIQGETQITRLSNDFGGQWVSAGSSLCSDLGCGAKAATTTQFGIPSPAAPHPCLSGLNANLVLTLSQSACGSCESCATLNQARRTLLDLLNSLDPPRTCLDSLKATLESLYLSCPCNCPCTGCNCPPYCLATKLSGGTCIAQTKFPLGFDLESYDPILRPFMRRVLSP